jgi:hypothetical protein
VTTSPVHKAFDRTDVTEFLNLAIVMAPFARRIALQERSGPPRWQVRRHAPVSNSQGLSRLAWETGNRRKHTRFALDSAARVELELEFRIAMTARAIIERSIDSGTADQAARLTSMGNRNRHIPATVDLARELRFYPTRSGYPAISGRPSFKGIT